MQVTRYEMRRLAMLLATVAAAIALVLCNAPNALGAEANEGGVPAGEAHSTAAEVLDEASAADGEAGVAGCDDAAASEAAVPQENDAMEQGARSGEADGEPAAASREEQPGEAAEQPGGDPIEGHAAEPVAQSIGEPTAEPAAGRGDAEAADADTDADTDTDAGESSAQAETATPAATATAKTAAAAPVAAAPSTTVATTPPATPAVPVKAASSAAPAKKAAAKKVAATVKAGWYSIQTVLNTAFAIQVKGNNSRAGTQLWLKKASSATGQAFKLVKSGGYYRIMAGTGFKSRVLMSANGKVALGQSKGADSLFRLVLNDAGQVSLVNKATGLALAVKGGKAKASAYLVGKKASSARAQTFMLAARHGILKDGIYSIRTNLTGKRALGPKGGSLGSGKSVVLANYASNLYQKWQVSAVSGKKNTYTIENIATGYRLTAASGKAATVKKASGKSNQWWQPVGAHGQVFLKNVATGKMLSLNKMSSAAGTAAMCLAASTKASARWKLSKVAVLNSGFYEFDSATNRKLALEVANASASAGANAQVGTVSASNSQKWFYDAGAKTLTCVESGKALAVKDASTASGANVIQAEPGTAKSLKWTISYVGGGNFKVASKLGHSLVLAADGNTAGANAKSVAYAGATAQKWHIAQVPEESTATVAIQFTLDQFARLQKSGNPYYSSTTLTYLKSVLNPSNGSKYKLADLRKKDNLTAAQINSFIATYGSSGKMANQGKAFVSACSTYGLNSAYLVAHAILESDWGRSELASGYRYGGGTIDGVKYKKGTYYNFFGIGAYDDSPLSGGRKAAIINGWTSPAKAIEGAAKWIATNYVYRDTYAQPTLYAMKWDYAYTKANGVRGWHQYATSLTWADSIGRLMEQCYAAAGVKPALSYITPTFK